MAPPGQQQRHFPHLARHPTLSRHAKDAFLSPRLLGCLSNPRRLPSVAQSYQEFNTFQRACGFHLLLTTTPSLGEKRLSLRPQGRERQHTPVDTPVDTSGEWTQVRGLERLSAQRGRRSEGRLLPLRLASTSSTPSGLDASTSYATRSSICWSKRGSDIAEVGVHCTCHASSHESSTTPRPPCTIASWGGASFRPTCGCRPEIRLSWACRCVGASAVVRDVRGLLHHLIPRPVACGAGCRESVFARRVKGGYHTCSNQDPWRRSSRA